VTAPPSPTAALDTEADALPHADKRTRRYGYGALVALSYIPIFFSSPGRVAADTKQYLYLDPTRLLERAVSMWDTNIGFGTVSHQNIGYVFPMGPFYWIFQQLNVPDWVAQRIWFGSILFFAGLGMLYLLRTLHVRGAGVPAAAVVYMLSPYILDYASRESVLLLPFSGLPWMLALVIRALRDEGGWRYPAAFAIVVQLVGGINATALIFAGVAPVLWIPYAVFISREVKLKRALWVTTQIGVLTILTSLWWMAGLSVQAGYGVDVLKYTETVKTVATASVAPEVFRGLGYWFFYGRDKLGPWIAAAVQYTQWVWLILVGYSLPIGGLLSAAFVRWKHRIFFAGLLFIGMGIAVGTHPFNDPSPAGALMKAFADASSAGLALRSTGRAVPLVMMCVAVFLAVGLNALVVWWAARPKRRAMDAKTVRRYVLLPAVIVMVLAVLNMPALWNGTFYGKNLQRPETIPTYWKQAAKAIDAPPHNKRDMEIPGADFASYRWGNLVEPLTPGITDRPYVARELVPWGSAASQNLLNAFDARLQLGILDPTAIAPVSRVMAVGTVVARNDLEVDRYNLIRPIEMRMLFTPTPQGLDAPQGFGTSLGPKLQYPLLDELTLALPPNVTDPPPVELYNVQNTPPILRAQSVAAPIVMAGDGDGIVSAASIGLITNRGIVMYSASDAKNPAELKQEIDRGATLVLTDSNRKRAERWGSVRDTTGYTERANETPVKDESDARLDMFPNETTDSQTTTEQLGGATVSASGYGDQVSYTPEDRPDQAMDGDLRTSWGVAAFSNDIGQFLRIDLDHAITADHVNLVQPLEGARNRYITQATLQFTNNGKTSKVVVPLDAASRTAAGQTIPFPSRTFTSLKIIVDADNAGPRADYVGLSRVGFAEVRLAPNTPGAKDFKVREVVKLPTDLLSTAGASSQQHQLVILLERLRVLPVPPRTDEELNFERDLTLPTTRSFGIGGTAHVDGTAQDPVLDTVLGLPDAAHGGLTVKASTRMPGDINSRASAAVDGDPTTAWQSVFGEPTGQYIDVTTPKPVTFNRLNLQIVADGRHSVPAQVTVSAGGVSRTVALPAIANVGAIGGTVAVPITFAPITGAQIRVAFGNVRVTNTLEYYSSSPTAMPIGIAELGIPGVQRAQPPTNFSNVCRTDLLNIDGKSLPVRISGTTKAAANGSELSVQLCGKSPTLTAGHHILESAIGRDGGISLDRLTLASAAGGAAITPGADGVVKPATAAATIAGDTKTAAGTAPVMKVSDLGRTDVHATVTGAHGPFEIVLGESVNAGWTATIDGKDLGPSHLVNGYANGWLVTSTGPGVHHIELVWTPQTTVWWALIISGVVLLFCFAIAFVSLKRRRTRARAMVAIDAAPQFRLPWAGQPHTPIGAVRAMISTIAVGLAGGVFITPTVGVVLAVVVVIMFRWPRTRGIVALASPVCLAGCALYIAVQQWRYQYTPLFEWPTFFDKVHVLGWLAAAFLAVDAVVEVVRDRRDRVDSADPNVEPGPVPAPKTTDAPAGSPGDSHV
jgi:arabinofuranan 3-O-arabinosyltransferase